MGVDDNIETLLGVFLGEVLGDRLMLLVVNDLPDSRQPEVVLGGYQIQK